MNTRLSIVAVSIAIVSSAPAGAQVTVKEHGERLAIANDLVAVTIDRSGGRISRLVYKPTGADLTWFGPYQERQQNEPGGGLLELNFWDVGFSEFRTSRFEWEVVESGPDKAVVEVYDQGETGAWRDLAVRKRLTVRRGDPLVECLWMFKNTNVGVDHSLSLKANLRAVLRSGSGDGRQRARRNTYFVPTTGGVCPIPFSPDQTPKRRQVSFDNLSRGWVAVVGDDGTGAALLTDFRYLRPMQKGFYLYLPQWPEQYWAVQPLAVKSLRTVELPYRILPFHGVGRVDGVSAEAVVGIGADGVVKGRHVRLGVDLYSRRARPVQVALDVRRLPDGPWQPGGTASLVLGAHQPKRLDTGFRASSDGTHVARVRVLDAAGKVLVVAERPVVVGRASGAYAMAPEAEPVRTLALAPQKLTGPASPHLAWARPRVGGPIRALFVVPWPWTRELVELRQRMDLTFDVVTSGIELVRPSYLAAVAQKELTLRDDDLQLVAHLLTANTYDVMVVRGVPYAAWPAGLQKRIVDKVAAGMGLVYTPERAAKPSKGTLLQTALLGGLTDKTIGTVTVPPVERLKLRQVRVKTHGHGRVVVGGDVWFALTPRVWFTYHATRYPYHEYWFAQWIQVLTWASGNEPAVRIASVDGPVESPTVRLAGAAPNTTLSFMLLDDYDRTVRQGDRPVGTGGSVTLPIGRVRRDGPLRLHVSARDAKGRVHDFAAVPLANRGPVTGLTLITPHRAYAHDATVPLAASFKATQAADAQATLDLWDSRDRLFHRQTATVHVKPGVNTLPLRTAVRRCLGNYLTARLRLHQGEATLDEADCAFVLDVPRQPVTDVTPGTIGIEVVEQPHYLWRFINRRKHAMGLRMTGWSRFYDLFSGFGMHLYAMNVAAVRAKGVYEGGSTIGHDVGGHVRNFCFHNPAHMEALLKGVRERVAAMRPYRLPFYGLADEQGIVRNTIKKPYDLCFCAHTLAAFRRYLAGRYASIDVLNRQWDTRFRDFGSVMPLRADQLQHRTNIAPWLSFRMFMARDFARLFGRVQQAVQETDGGAHVACTANCFGEVPWTGNIEYEFMKNLSGLTAYSDLFDRGRSFFRGFGRRQPYQSYWTGYGFNWMPHDLWTLTVWGGAFPLLFYHTPTDLYGRPSMAGVFDAGFNPGPHFAVARPILDELHRGLGCALVTSPVRAAPVAILFSYEDLYAEYLAKGPTGYQGYGGTPRRSQAPARIGSLVQQRGLVYDYVVPEQVAEGRLSTYPVLALPTVCYLSDKAVGAMERYLDAGGKIVPYHLDADVFASCTQYGAPRRDRGAVRRLLERIGAGGATLDNALPRSDFVIHGDDKRVPSAGFVFVPHDRGPIAYYAMLRSYWGPPLKDAFELCARRKGFVYDVRRRRLLGPSPRRVPMTVRKQDAAVLAVLPYTVEAVAVHARYDPSAGAIACRLTVSGSPGATVGDHVVHVECRGPDGAVLRAYTQNCLTRAGLYQWRIPVAVNDPAGPWQIRATEVISGRQGQARVNVTSPSPRAN